MRIFQRFSEALPELKRELMAFGITQRTQTMQDKWVADNPDYETVELLNYEYCVSQPECRDLEFEGSGLHKDYCEFEFADRISNPSVNPGTSWTMRPEIWAQFLEPGPSFSYTYSERLWQLPILIENLKKYPDNRNHFLAIWDPCPDIERVGERRTPCSLGYYFVYRQGKLNMTYLMRSCDYMNHLANDVWLATRLLYYVCGRVDMKPGTFTHFIGSLHIYRKELKGIF